MYFRQYIQYFIMGQFLSPARRSWGGLLVSSRMSPRLSICPRFISGADLGNPLGDFFHIARTYPFKGVDEPSGVYGL